MQHYLDDIVVFSFLIGKRSVDSSQGWQDAVRRRTLRRKTATQQDGRRGRLTRPRSPRSSHASRSCRRSTIRRAEMKPWTAVDGGGDAAVGIWTRLTDSMTHSVDTSRWHTRMTTRRHTSTRLTDCTLRWRTQSTRWEDNAWVDTLQQHWWKTHSVDTPGCHTQTTHLDEGDGQKMSSLRELPPLDSSMEQQQRRVSRRRSDLRQQPLREDDDDFWHSQLSPHTHSTVTSPDYSAVARP